MQPDMRTNKNLCLHLPPLGRVLIQPSYYELEEAKNLDLIVFPRFMNEEEMEAAADWASYTQVPIFCTKRDIKALEKQSFKVYRFQKIWSYHFFQMAKASVEFIPSQKVKNFRFFKYFGRPQAFHMVLRPVDAQAVLLLGSLDFSQDEIELIRSLKLPVLAECSKLSEMSLRAAAEALDCEITNAEDFDYNKKEQKIWTVRALPQKAPMKKEEEPKTRVDVG